MAFRPVKPGVQRLWEQLEDEEHAIVIERERLQDIWRQISAMNKANAEAREAFENEANFNFIDGDERVLLNVGGHVFPTTAEVLCRDRYSLLACVCKKTDSPIAKDEDGTFFFERDWWIFRYILQFLRTGDLPQEQALLREMYDEAAFYRLNSLRRAIQRRRAATEAARDHSSLVQGVTPEAPRQLWPAAGRSAAERRASLRHSMRGRNPLREPLPDPFGFSSSSKR